MIIPELTPFDGTLSDDTVLAIDDGAETYKISAPMLVESLVPEQRQIWYGTSASSASTTAKTATCSGFALKAGETIAIKFTNTNTASTPTLNVNGTGAVTIRSVSGDTKSLAGLWRAGEVVIFTYDGTNWLVDSSSRAGVLVVSKTSISSLPTSITDAAISAKHVVLNAIMSNPAAQASDWTVTTSNGSLTIAGTISGTTDITLYLGYQTN